MFCTEENIKQVKDVRRYFLYYELDNRILLNSKNSKTLNFEYIYKFQLPKIKRFRAQSLYLQ